MKTKMINTRILLSGATILAAAAVIVGATFAFFSDTETSTGNTLAAGAIDLQIDNTSYVTDAQGNLVESESTTWELADLDDGHLFFNFLDIKPGDIGEDTISIHVDNNDAWVCAAARVTEDSDVSYTEPELDDDPTINEDDPENTDGELAENLNFAFWADDGDNVLEDDEESSIFIEGPASNLDGVGGVATLADSENNIWTGASDNPLTGDSVAYVGKAWCFGTLTPDPVAQDDVNTGNPIDRGTGFTCNGDPEENNAAQTDRVVGDFQFYAVQSRNNADFTCAEDFTPDWEEEEEGEPVGAALGAYTSPDCTTTISSDIQGAVDAATNGDTICVDDGSYDETVVIDKPLTLAAVNGPLASSTIEGGVQIDSSDVTLTGFIVNPGDVPADPGDIAVFLNGSLSNIEVSYNDIDGLGAGSTRGVLTTTGATYSNVVIDNNVIHDLTTGIYINPVTSGLLTISNNDIDDNVAGIGGLNGATVVNNEFEHSSASSEAIGIDNSFDANNATVNYNNFLDDMRINTYVGFSDTVDAENNFFGPNGGAAQVDETNGDVDYDPEAGVAYPHN